MKGNSANGISLREVVEDDLPILFEHQSDPVAHRMAVFPPRDHEAFMVHWRKILADDGIVKRTILVDETVAGSVVCFERSDRYFLGYWIDRGFWGRGIASHAVALFLDLVETRPLHAHVASGNGASIRILEKSGFQAVQGSPQVPMTIEGEQQDLLFILA